MKNNNKKKTFLASISVAVAFLFLSVQVSSAQQYKIMEAIPGFFEAGSVISFPEMISAIYKFGIWTVGIAAMFMLTVGGFMYVTSAGNTSSAGSAKRVITDALLGLAVAMLAYAVLNIINPNLVQTGSIAGTPMTPPPAQTLPPGTPIGDNCNPGIQCFNCPNCVPISDCKPQEKETCKLDGALASKINSALASLGGDNDMWLTEGWPPTINHASVGHKNGTCADLNYKSADRSNPSPEKVKTAYEALKSAGISAAKLRYESSPTNCPGYEAVGVSCTKTSAAPHFHMCL